MSRFESSTNEAEAAEQDILLCFAVDLNFAGGHIRLTDGIGSLTIGGNTYDGSGKFQLDSQIEEGVQVITRPLKILLSAVDSSLYSEVRSGGYQGRDVTVYLCFQDRTTHALLDTPETIWQGFMDTITTRLDGGEASFTLNCEHRLRTSPRKSRYTDADQQYRNPGDRFFDHVPNIAGFVGKWGESNVAYGAPGTKPNRPYIKGSNG